MESTCPSCLSSVKHEDSLQEVVCHCGAKFSPGTLEEFPSLEEAMAAGGTNTPPPEPPTAASTPSFEESESAFKAIRDFGEGVVNAESQAPAPSEVKASEPNQLSMEVAHASTPGSGAILSDRPSSEVSSEACLVSTGADFDGYQIRGYFPPISALLELNPSEPDPLAPLFKIFNERVGALGANAIIGWQWKFVPNGTHIVASGVPVLCQKVDDA